MPALRSLPIAILLVLVIASLAGGAFLMTQSSAPAPIEIILPPPTTPPDIQVYISGEVSLPGVYTVEEGARLADAVEAAGGATQQADLSQVNLSLKLRDQDHFHIPRQGEPAQSGDTDASSGGPGSPLDINRAPQAALETLPGIGAVKAADIVAYREENGPFRRVEDLLLVPGIGPATLEQLRDLVMVR